MLDIFQLKETHITLVFDASLCVRHLHLSCVLSCVHTEAEYAFAQWASHCSNICTLKGRFPQGFLPRESTLASISLSFLKPRFTHAAHWKSRRTSWTPNLHHLLLNAFSAAFSLCTEPPKCVAKPVKESRSVYSLNTNKGSEVWVGPPTETLCLF